jgi:hypothetical protein
MAEDIDVDDWVRAAKKAGKRITPSERTRKSLRKLNRMYARAVRFFSEDMYRIAVGGQAQYAWIFCRDLLVPEFRPEAKRNHRDS